MQPKEKSPIFPYWPFWLADGLLLTWAALIWGFSEESHSMAAHSFYVLAVLLAFVFGVAPIFLEKWVLAKERQRRLEAEFQSQVARALGEILDRLVAGAAGAPASLASARSAEQPDWLKPALEVIGERLTALHTQLERMVPTEEASDGKKGGRRGVNGILYPPKTKASWVNKGEKVREEIPVEAEADVAEEDKNGAETEAPERLPLEVWVMALVGIGNRPYLRGNLPGLSESKGVSMEFMEIGKWRWIGEEVEELKNLSVEVWLNDTIPAKNNPVIVTHHMTEIRPAFP